MQKKFIYLNTRDEFFRVESTKIVYFEADGNYTNFTLCNGQRGSVSLNLSAMQEALSASLKEDAAVFARIGRKYILNLAHVYHISIPKQTLVLSDGATFTFRLTISKEALKVVRDLFVKRRGAITGAMANQ